MNILCKLGFHKWILYLIRVDGELESGRYCDNCPKKQWDRETHVRHGTWTYRWQKTWLNKLRG